MYSRMHVTVSTVRNAFHPTVSYTNRKRRSHRRAESHYGTSLFPFDKIVMKKIFTLLGQNYP